MTETIIRKSIASIEDTDTITEIRPLVGGDINQVYRVDTAHSRYCIKVNLADHFPGMFEAERLGLELLDRRSQFRIPGVFSVFEHGNQSALILEYLDSLSPQPGFWETFGELLADMHQQSAEQFGLDHSNYIGRLNQDNDPTKDWVSFFRDHRLQPQVERALNSGAITRDDAKKFDRFYNEIPSLFPEEPPALTHGDLWSGNYIVSSEGPALIDPAIAYSHRETDLAMMQLFGGFDGRLYDAYHSVYPLETNWRSRMKIYQLYPLMVHVNLFGGGYRISVLETLSNYQ